MIQFEKMQDMELQVRCHEAGNLFVESVFSTEDEVTKNKIRNAVAAGYSKGWRDLQALLMKQQDEVDYLVSIIGSKSDLCGRGEVNE